MAGQRSTDRFGVARRPIPGLRLGACINYAAGHGSTDRSKGEAPAKGPSWGLGLRSGAVCRKMVAGHGSTHGRWAARPQSPSLRSGVGVCTRLQRRPRTPFRCMLVWWLVIICLVKAL